MCVGIGALHIHACSDTQTRFTVEYSHENIKLVCAQAEMHVPLDDLHAERRIPRYCVMRFQLESCSLPRARLQILHFPSMRFHFPDPIASPNSIGGLEYGQGTSKNCVLATGSARSESCFNASLACGESDCMNVLGSTNRRTAITPIVWTSRITICSIPISTNCACQFSPITRSPHIHTHITFRLTKPLHHVPYV